MSTLARGEAAFVQLAGFGIHQIGGEGARIATEQRVRERNITPEEAHIVQANQQHGQGVDEACCRVGAKYLLKEGPIGERELQVRRHECGGKRVAVGVDAASDHRTAVNTRDREAGEVAEHFVLAASHLGGGFFDSDHAAREHRETHEVAREPLRQRHNDAAGPLRQRGRPRQGEKPRIDGAGGDAQRHGLTPAVIYMSPTQT